MLGDALSEWHVSKWPGSANDKHLCQWQGSVSDQALWVTCLCEWQISMTDKSVSGVLLSECPASLWVSLLWSWIVLLMEGLCWIVTFIHMSTSFSMSYKEIGLLSAGVSESMRQRTEILGDGGEQIEQTEAASRRFRAWETRGPSTWRCMVKRLVFILFLVNSGFYSTVSDVWCPHNIYI